MATSQQHTAFYYPQPVDTQLLNNQPNLQMMYWPPSYGTYRPPTTPTTPFSAAIPNLYNFPPMSPPHVTPFSPTTPMSFCLPSLPATPQSFNLRPRRDSPRIFAPDRSPPHDLSYKTALCQNWRTHGDCQFKEECRFAHGTHELRLPKLKHPKYKTVVCRNFANTGFCTYGARCTFIHERGSPPGRIFQNSNYSHRDGNGKRFSNKFVNALEEDKPDMKDKSPENKLEQSCTTLKLVIFEGGQLDDTKKLADELGSKVKI